MSSLLPRPHAGDAGPLRDQPLRLWIEGTERLRPDTLHFVSAFGVDVRTLCDLRAYARCGDAASFPPGLIALLHELHQRGCVMGAETMALRFHGRRLQGGKALYFTLVNLQAEPRVLAFIDRQRCL